MLDNAREGDTEACGTECLVIEFIVSFVEVVA